MALQDIDSGVRYAAVNRLTDQAALVKVALQDSGDIRYSAIVRLTEEPLLAKVVIESTGDLANIQGRLTDQTQLTKVAAEARLISHRIWAIGKITEQEPLRQWAEHSPFSAIRKTAVSRITDDAFLLQRLPVEPSFAVRLAIVDSLSDKVSKSYVARHAYHEKERSMALSWLNDPQENAEAQKLFAKTMAMERDKVDDEVLLQRILEGELDVIRFVAVSRLKEPAVIEQAALRSQDRAVLKILLAKIKDDASLGRIAAGAADPAMRLAAAQKAGIKSWRDIFGGIEAGAPAGKLDAPLAALSLFKVVPTDARNSLQAACLTLIRHGDDSYLPELCDLLPDYGDKELAEIYLNCGRLDLVQVAKEWAYNKGYTVGTRGEKIANPSAKAVFGKPVVMPGGI